MDSDLAWPAVIEALQLPSGCRALDVTAKADDVLSRALARRDPAATVSILNICSRAGRSDGLGDFLRETAGGDSFHLIVFRHLIDDLVQAAVAEYERMPFDPCAEEQKRAVVRALRAYWRSGDLEQIAAPRFVETIDACRAVLHPAGSIVFSHEVFDADLRLGHPLELYADYVPLIRGWLAGAAVALRETRLDGFDPHWWVCLQHVADTQH